MITLTDEQRRVVRDGLAAAYPLSRAPSVINHDGEAIAVIVSELGITRPEARRLFDAYLREEMVRRRRRDASGF